MKLSNVRVTTAFAIKYIMRAYAFDCAQTVVVKIKMKYT